MALMREDGIQMQGDSMWVWRTGT